MTPTTVKDRLSRLMELPIILGSAPNVPREQIFAEHDDQEPRRVRRSGRESAARELLHLESAPAVAPPPPGTHEQATVVRHVSGQAKFMGPYVVMPGDRVA